MTDITFRRGTSDDAEACHQLLWESATDLGRRQATPLQGTADEWWSTSEPLYRYLAEHAAEWWMAERDDEPRLVGYARSTEREGGLFELTEFFVRPGSQSQGLGRALLDRAFPPNRSDVRAIIATTDVRALARYYTAGTEARFPIFSLTGEPASVDSPAELSATAVAPDDQDGLAAIAGIEHIVLGYPRGPAELAWLMAQREGYLYRRDGRDVGFAFVSKGGSGPVAALEPNDLPAMLLHVEGRARALGVERLELEVPAPNEVAIRHLLSRGFRIDPWINMFMSSRPFGQFDRFIGVSPPIFL